MTVIAIKPAGIVTPSGNGATAPQPASAALPPGLIQLDEALAALHAHKGAWVATGVDERIALLAEIRQRMAAIGQRWVGSILEAKGTAGDAFGTGEEWANYALVLRWMRLLHRSLLDIQRYGRPRLPESPKTRPDGQASVRVYPQTHFDRMLFMGVTGEVWMQPGVTPADVTARQAAICQEQSHPGQVLLLLGAGNAAFIQFTRAGR